MYKVYPRNLARASTPAVSVTKLGRITLNSAGARFLVERKSENVFLLWDADERRFALKPTTQGDSTAYQVRFAPDNAGAGFSAKPFLRMIGYDFEQSRVLPTSWSESEQFFEVTLPEEGFNRKFPRNRKARRSAQPKAVAAGVGV